MTVTADLGELQDSTSLLDDPDRLRERAADDGYLFFRGLIPREPVLEVRHDLLQVFAESGWLDPSAPIDEGIVNDAAINRIPEAELRGDIGVSIAGYVRIQQVQSMHRLPHHPALLDLYERLFGEAVFVHPRHIIRAMTSHAALRATPPHQDFPLIQGTPNTWTCWSPLGDCPAEMGSLAVARGSHRLGYLPVAPAEGAGGITAQLCRDDDVCWLGADFRAGDVLTFPSYTVHRSLPPLDRTRVRLSMDVRYQPASEPVEAKSLAPHADAPWEELYRGWTVDDIQYYWERETPRLSPWDDSLLQPSRRIC
jgi:hypothetical protein